MKPKYPLILFDLDGTLTDSAPGITSSVRYALEQLSKPVPPMSVLRKFVGPPLYDSFTSLCGLTPAETEDAIALFRKDYKVNGFCNNSVYPGIPEVLCALRNAGSVLVLATSKPASMTEKVLGRFQLAQYFQFISAADESDRSNGMGKEALILPALAKFHCPPEEALMIGDTRFDAAGAREAGVSFLGVLYGFGTEDEMRREGASLFVSSPSGLLKEVFPVS